MPGGHKPWPGGLPALTWPRGLDLGLDQLLGLGVGAAPSGTASWAEAGAGGTRNSVKGFSENMLKVNCLKLWMKLKTVKDRPWCHTIRDAIVEGFHYRANL